MHCCGREKETSNNKDNFEEHVQKTEKKQMGDGESLRKDNERRVGDSRGGNTRIKQEKEGERKEKRKIKKKKLWLSLKSNTRISNGVYGNY